VKRVVKDYEAMAEEILQQVKIKYPTGYESHLVSYTNAEGKIVTALPFATDDIYYLIRMTIAEARQIVRDDEDFDDEGILRGEVADVEVDSEYGGSDEDVEDIADTSSDEDDEDHIIPTRKRGRDDDDGFDDDY
jgi:DNA-directed RNA polymerase subunit delta